MSYYFVVQLFNLFAESVSVHALLSACIEYLNTHSEVSQAIVEVCRHRSSFRYCIRSIAHIRHIFVAVALFEN